MYRRTRRRAGVHKDKPKFTGPPLPVVQQREPIISPSFFLNKSLKNEQELHLLDSNTNLNNVKIACHWFFFL